MRAGEHTEEQPDNQAVDGGAAADSVAVEEELLVEEVSIDGMCGVY